MTIDKETFRSFDLVGKDLSNRGLISSHSGNMSMISGGKIIITRRSAMLGWLQPEDLVVIDLKEEDAHSGLIASTEANVHRNIYKETDAMAIVHSHSPCSTALSMIEDEITCIDAEGMFLYKKIPVVECDIPVGSYEVAEKIAQPLKNYPAAIVRSHGIFAKGTTLEDALGVVTGVEQSADIRYRIHLLGKPLIRDYSKEKGFSDW
ncbi:MAG: fuculose phosphate aldolase [Bacteroidetes bacterium]|jgi:L-fuculose-phosphate aldolase|nr:fuculose phosphate aldolase [Bacteroidota bacterium]MBT6685050.1 fuculose phosphate aldolase [Bacteroidota bacterium]MBT7143189.1 fuculose phosphate aldolase [Bacteroidota bacterium]MBT7491011.1 fuculose phosphate aldolase [Bacteroidota bacterium]